MDDITRRQQQRFQALKYLYDKSQGTAQTQVMRDEMRQALGLSEEEARAISLYLVKEGLTDGTMYSIGLTHRGVKEVEAFLTDPAKPTEHFPMNVINIGQGSGIHIQQGTVDSNQSGSAPSDSPSASGKGNPPVPRHDGLVRVETHADKFKIIVECGTLQPKRSIASDTFLLGKAESGMMILAGLIYAENLSTPKAVELLADFTVDHKEVSVSDLTDEASEEDSAELLEDHSEEEID